MLPSYYQQQYKAGILTRECFTVKTKVHIKPR